MSKEQSIEDFIPPSFDLEKYDSLASSSTEEWLTNIVARLPPYYNIEYYLEILDTRNHLGISKAAFAEKYKRRRPDVYGEKHEEGDLLDLGDMSRMNIYPSEALAPNGYSIIKHHNKDKDFIVSLEYPNILSGDIKENIRCGAKRILEIDSPTFQYILGLFCSNDKIKSLSVNDIVSLTSSIRGNPELRKKFNRMNNSNVSSIDAIFGEMSSTPEEDACGYTFTDELIPEAEYEKWDEISRSSASLYTDRLLQDKNELDYVQVDLTLPDHVLLEQFSNWLAEQRKAGRNTHNHNKKYLTKAKMRFWYESRVIPYMDVVQWNEKQGRTVPHGIAGRIIFSDMSKNDFRNPAGIIADTTLKHMKELTSRRTLILLSAQIISEIGSKV